MDDFVTSPSWEKIQKRKKADLLILANYYEVDVPYGARKSELKLFVRGWWSRVCYPN